MSAASANLIEKRRELEELRELSRCAGWKDRLLPRLQKLREAHQEAGLARHATPEKRAEHIEAYHDLRELIAYVPERLETLTRELAADFATPDSNLYDIGCSTATTLLAMDPLVDPSVRFIGVDNSPS